MSFCQIRLCMPADACSVAMFLAAAALPHQQLAKKQQELATVCAAPALHCTLCVCRCACSCSLCLLLLLLPLPLLVLTAAAVGLLLPCCRCCCCCFVLQVPPVLNQFVTRALDKNQAETLFKLMLKYRCDQQPHESSTVP